MIFENIFKFATDLAGAGTTSESTLAKLLPTTPSEKSAVPQHDPSQPAPPADDPQDPRLVRDTMPHLSAIGDYVAAVTGAMATAPTKQEDLVSDPSQTTDAAQSIVKAGQDAVKQFGTSATKPSPEPSAPPTTTAPATPEPPAANSWWTAPTEFVNATENPLHDWSIGGETVVDTLFADISEWQPTVDYSYPYAALSIRSNDGTYCDRNFEHNFAVARNWLDSGRLGLLIVYFVVRPNWQDSVATHLAMQGTDRPDVVSMIDAESWSGQIVGDHSGVFNNAVWAASRWRGTPIQGRPRRVIGYLNPHDSSIWPTRPPIGWVVPSYGSLPRFSAHTDDLRRNMIAHQYTNGEGYGGGLPEGYGTVRCDMNAANGRSTAQLRTALGIGAPP